MPLGRDSPSLPNLEAETVRKMTFIHSGGRRALPAAGTSIVAHLLVIVGDDDKVTGNDGGTERLGFVDGTAPLEVIPETSFTGSAASVLSRIYSRPGAVFVGSGSIRSVGIRRPVDRPDPSAGPLSRVTLPSVCRSP